MNIPTAAVWYIIKKASAKFGKRTVLYRVPRMGTLAEKRNASFLFNLGVLKFLICLTVVGRCDKM